jgi:hypothetical protein
MKRKIIAAALGIAACGAVSSAYGQGSVIFSNYYVSTGGSIIAQAPISYALSVPLKGGELVGSEFTAALLYSSTGAAGTFSLLAGSESSILGPDGGTAAEGSGIFGQVVVTLPSYTSGPAYFEAEAYNGSTYASSTIVGISAVIELSAVSTGIAFPGDLYSDNPDTVTAMTAFTVSAIPEPTTLALGGLGLAGLLMARRKKA